MKHWFAAAFLLSPLASAQAAIQTKTIEYKVGEGTFVGFLAWDDAVATERTPAPGVVVCPEWWGNNDYAQSRARQLAELGYVALSIDMYGKGDDAKPKVTTDPKVAGEWAGSVYKDPKVLEARVVAGMKQLTDQKIVDSNNVAAIGYCMGGSVALALARTGADLKAVVAFHASSISAAGDEATAKAANDKIKATLLICHGQDDGFVQPGELDKFHAQMKASHIDYALTAFSGAVHAFTNPKADNFKLPGVAYNKNADVRSWAAMKALFEEKLGSQFVPGLRQGFKERMAEGANAEFPGPLSDDQIAAMNDREEIVRAYASRAAQIKANTKLDDSTKMRLQSELEKLKKRLVEVVSSKGSK